MPGPLLRELKYSMSRLTALLDEAAVRPELTPAVRARVRDIQRKLGELDDVCHGFTSGNGEVRPSVVAEAAPDRTGPTGCPLRCLVCEPSDKFTAALSDMLRPAGVEVVARIADPSDAVVAVKRAQPDVVLASLDHSGHRRQSVPEIKSVPVLVMSWAMRSDEILEAFRAGAQGFIHKGATVEDWVAALRAAVGGGAAQVDAGASPGAGSGDEDVVRARPGENLTVREQQIVDLIGIGCSNKQVASHLGIANQTVKNHLYNIMRKLEVSSRLHLSLRAKAAVRNPRRGDLQARDNGSPPK